MLSKVGSASLRIWWRRLACTAATSRFALLDGFLLSGAGGVPRQPGRLVNGCLAQLFQTLFQNARCFSQRADEVYRLTMFLDDNTETAGVARKPTVEHGHLNVWFVDA